MSPYLQLREYTPDDYRMVSGWWADHYGNDFRPGFVPAKAYIVTAGEVDAAFFGIAPMTPDFSYLAFPLVNPNLDKESRDKAIDFVIDAASMLKDTPVIWYSGNGEKFLNRLREKSWFAAESGCQHMFFKSGEIG